MSVATVKSYVTRLLTKLDLTNRVQIALLVNDRRGRGAAASERARHPDKVSDHQQAGRHRRGCRRGRGGASSLCGRPAQAGRMRSQCRSARAMGDDLEVLGRHRKRS